MTKHTPGPWRVENGSVYAQQVRIAFMDRDELDTRPVEWDANARLVAAAPELLAVLKYVASYLDAEDDRGIVREVSEAITQATGQESDA